METLRKGTVSAYFRVNCQKLCVNCAFSQNFHTRKLGEITVFFAVFGGFNRSQDPIEVKPSRQLPAQS